MSCSKKHPIFTRLIIAIMIYMIGGFPTLVYALPQDPTVQAGSITIEQASSERLNIKQSTTAGIIDWRSFSIGESEHVDFQLSRGGRTMNRVTGGDPSMILGRMTSNGEVFLLNQNGIVFGRNSRVDVAGLVASTANITNQNFLDGNYDFNIASPLQAMIINEGNITVKEAGLLAFVAPGVKNSGIIEARLGKVSLASGRTFTLDLYGDQLVSLGVDGKILESVLDENGIPLSHLIENSGTINAEGGRVYLGVSAAKEVVNNAINVSGLVQAQSAETVNGEIVLWSGDGGRIDMAGTLDASGNDAGESGGSVSITGDRVFNSGTVIAEGDSAGGTVTMDANKVIHSGTVTANSNSGTGGTVNVAFAENYIDMEAARVEASGFTGGGSVKIDGGENGKLFTSGSHEAKGTGAGSTGGTVHLLGNEVTLAAAKVDASGDSGGGQVRIGGDIQGADGITRSTETLITSYTTVKADAINSGDGGSVAIWSDGTTNFFGLASAQGGQQSGNGGFIEVSGKEDLTVSGNSQILVTAVNGEAGTILFDPKNIIVDDNGTLGDGTSLSSTDLASPTHTATNQFGTNTALTGGYDYDNGDINYLITLENGNIVVVDHLADTANTDAGAVYLYNGTTGALKGTVTGNTANDEVGRDGVKDLGNGNFVVASSEWDNGAATDAGAVTVVSGTTGAIIDSNNSGNTTTVTALNSLHGSRTNDYIGRELNAAGSNSNNQGDITVLDNGNFVVASPFWDLDGSTADVGAVTLVNGTTGKAFVDGSFTVSTANSLHSTNAGDQVGINERGEVLKLTDNGNYVVMSSNWDNGSFNKAGAVTVMSGADGKTLIGDSLVVSTSNSLHGTAANNEVGYTHQYATLSNGNFVVGSSRWDNGGTNNVGAVTLMNGSTGYTVAQNDLAVSTSNSLHGSLANDSIGGDGVVEVADGNIAIASRLWDLNGSTTNVGAVTLMSGTTGAAVVDGKFAISTANSLHGTTASDDVGWDGVTALSNGNYVVASADWNGVASGAGAVTVMDGKTGLTVAEQDSSKLAVSTSNSMYGTTANDQLGLFVGGRPITDLGNGTFVLRSYDWTDYGTDIASTADDISKVGAITLVSGTTGKAVVDGEFRVSTANSLHGSVANDRVGYRQKVEVLDNGNYVVASRLWDDNKGTVSNTADDVSNVGAVTLVDGTTGKAIIDQSLTVSTSNSVHGSLSGDQVGGGGVVEIGNSDFLVASKKWDNGGTTDVGAVTLVSGMTGKAGTDGSLAVSTSNSIVGDNADDGDNMGKPIYNSKNDNYVIRFRGTGASDIKIGSGPQLGFTSSLSFSDSPGSTFIMHSEALENILGTGANLILQANNDITFKSDVIVNNTSGDGGDLSLFAGRSILINSNINTDNGDLFLTANADAADGTYRDAGGARLMLQSGKSIVIGSGGATFTMEMKGAADTNGWWSSYYLGSYQGSEKMDMNYPMGVKTYNNYISGGVRRDIIDNELNDQQTHDITLSMGENPEPLDVSIDVQLPEIYLDVDGNFELSESDSQSESSESEEEKLASLF